MRFVVVNPCVENHVTTTQISWIEKEVTIYERDDRSYDAAENTRCGLTTRTGLEASSSRLAVINQRLQSGEHMATVYQA